MQSENQASVVHVLSRYLPVPVGTCRYLRYLMVNYMLIYMYVRVLNLCRCTAVLASKYYMYLKVYM